MDLGSMSRRQFTAGAGAVLANSMIGVAYAQDAKPGQPLPNMVLESYSSQVHQEAARILARSFTEVGFPITLRPVDFGQLLGKVLGQCPLGGDKGLKVVFTVVAAASADAGPFRMGGRRIVIAGGRIRLVTVLREYVVEPGAELVLQSVAAGEALFHPVV